MTLGLRLVVPSVRNVPMNSARRVVAQVTPLLVALLVIEKRRNRLATLRLGRA